MMTTSRAEETTVDPTTSPSGTPAPRDVVRAGRTYQYHSGGSQPPARCDKPTQ